MKWKFWQKEKPEQRALFGDFLSYNSASSYANNKYAVICCLQMC